MFNHSDGDLTKQYCMTEIQLLITKYLLGEASPEEAEQVEFWLQDKANRKEFDKQLRLVQLILSKDDYKVPNVASEWKLMSSQLKTKKLPSISSGGIKTIFFYISAVVVIIAATYFWLVSNRFGKPLPIVYHSADNVKLETTSAGEMYLDTKTTVRYSRDKNKVDITLTGGCFFREQEKTRKNILIILGNLTAIPVNAVAYFSYDSSRQSATVYVQSGSVTVSGIGLHVTLQPGESLQYDAISKKVSKNTTSINSYGYATKIFDFSDTPLSEVLGYLQKAYSVTIKLKDVNLGDCRITTRFDNKPLKDVLDIISFTLNLKYEYINNNFIQIFGKGCLKE